jgi:hypothetical protein
MLIALKPLYTGRSPSPFTAKAIALLNPNLEQCGRFYFCDAIHIEA